MPGATSLDEDRKEAIATRADLEHGTSRQLIDESWDREPSRDAGATLSKPVGARDVLLEPASLPEQVEVGLVLRSAQLGLHSTQVCHLRPLPIVSAGDDGPIPDSASSSPIEPLQDAAGLARLERQLQPQGRQLCTMSLQAEPQIGCGQGGLVSIDQVEPGADRAECPSPITVRALQQGLGESGLDADLDGARYGRRHTLERRPLSCDRSYRVRDPSTREAGLGGGHLRALGGKGGCHRLGLVEERR
jgi:hypothetical protein